MDAGLVSFFFFVFHESYDHFLILHFEIILSKAQAHDNRKVLRVPGPRAKYFEFFILFN